MHRRPAAPLILIGMVLSVLTIFASDDYDLTADASSQRIQNVRADADHLSRMADEGMVRRFRRAGLLVPVAVSTRAYYLRGVPARFRYLRPWARLFVTRLSHQFHARFGARLRITALVRTAAYQRILDRRNGNAAAASGPLRSSHLTGATLDISKRFMQRPHLDWMRRVLFDLRRREVLYAVEEFSQPCFHVMIYRNYPEYVRQITS
jgi:hypothetical protein